MEHSPDPKHHLFICLWFGYPRIMFHVSIFAVPWVCVEGFVAGRWFQLFFNNHSYLGKWSNLTICFFQMCWFNHQHPPHINQSWIFCHHPWVPVNYDSNRLIRPNLRLLLPRWEMPRCPKAGSYESICSAQSYCHGCDNTWGPSPEVFTLTDPMGLVYMPTFTS